MSDCEWKLDKHHLQLYHTSGYSVDLEECETSAQALDAIIQVSQKHWANNTVLADFIRMLDSILKLQQTTCSGGVERGPVNRRRVNRAPRCEHLYRAGYGQCGHAAANGGRFCGHHRRDK